MACCLQALLFVFFGFVFISIFSFWSDFATFTALQTQKGQMSNLIASL